MPSIDDKFKILKIGEKRYQLNARGLVCPYPELLAVRALNNLHTDDTLEIILDNPPSARDIPPIIEKRGYVVQTSIPSSSVWTITVKAKK